MTQKINSFQQSCRAIREFETKNKMKLVKTNWENKKVVMDFYGDSIVTRIVSLEEAAGKADVAINNLRDFYLDNRYSFNAATKNSLLFCANEIKARSDCKWGCKVLFFWKSSPAQKAFDQFTKAMNRNAYSSPYSLELN